MKIYKFSQLGKRGNNEDCLGVTDGLITVCDGMGGHNYGERASAFVVQNLTSIFGQREKLGKMEIQRELNKVQDDLNHVLDSEPELEKMGTTFTGIFFTPDVWYAAHIGDSRIYLFRPAEKKLWHTWDHSLVGELMRTHEITVEAGRFHPMSNRIAKAIIAQKDGKPVSASIVKLDNLQKGDVLLLCSDGVIEGWGDYEFVQLLSDNSLSFEQKCEKIRQQCDEKSKDNNTAIIVEIEEQDAFNYGDNGELDWTTFADVEADYKKYVQDNSDDVQEVKPQPQPQQPKPQKPQEPKEEPEEDTAERGGKGWIYIVLAFVLIAVLSYFLLLRGGNSETETEAEAKPEPTEQPAPAATSEETQEDAPINLENAAIDAVTEKNTEEANTSSKLFEEKLNQPQPDQIVEDDDDDEEDEFNIASENSPEKPEPNNNNNTNENPVKP